MRLLRCLPATPAMLTLSWHRAEAYNALQEAVKFNRESWKIWENFFYAAIVRADELLVTWWFVACC